MKIIFTSLVLLSFCLFGLSQNPFQKRNGNKKHADVSLKASLAGEQPTSVVIDWWENNAWENPSTTTFTYNPEGLLWIEQSPNERMTHTYHVSGKKEELIIENWDDINWIKINKENWQYDTEGNQSEYTSWNWEVNMWVLSAGNRYMAIYDAGGDAIEEIYSHYEVMGGEWIEDDGYKTDNIYSNGFLTEQIEYDRQGGEWLIEMRFLWYYDDQDVLERALAYTHDGTDYHLMGRYTNVSWYIWDPVGHTENSYISTYTIQEYGGPDYPNEEPDNDGHYTNSEKMTATYPDGDGGGTPPTSIEITQAWNIDTWVYDWRWTWEQMADYESYFDEEWDGSSWLATDFTKQYKTAVLVYNQDNNYDVSGNLIYGSIYTNAFDGYGNKTEEKSESHNGDENWVQNWGEKYIYAYDGGTSKVLSRITQDWDNGSSMYVNNMREIFDYTPTNLDALKQKGIKIFPTSFKSNIAVKSAYEGKACFYSLAGNLVHEEAISSGLTNINTSSFKRGYYIIKIVSKKGEYIQKAIKQ